MYECACSRWITGSAMRADLFLCDPHRIIITGPTTLHGRTLDSRDHPVRMRSSRRRWPRKGRAASLEIETVERGYAEPDGTAAGSRSACGAEGDVMGEWGNGGVGD